jgi:hypothetical protein
MKGAGLSVDKFSLQQRGGIMQRPPVREIPGEQNYSKGEMKNEFTQ